MLQLPWIVLGDWHVNPSELDKSGCLLRVHGQVMAPPLAVTCDTGTEGPLIDYAVMSEAMAPCTLDCQAALDVPWRPHIGIT
eukprot:6989624-Pyramimonas_sp.AAC.1